MNKDIYTKAENLKELLEKDPRIIKLNKLEKKMNEDEEVMSLAYKKDMASVNYSDVLNHYSEESPEAKKALKELHEAKLKLDNHPLVREYLNAYIEVRDLYYELNDILLSNLNLNMKGLKQCE